MTRLTLALADRLAGHALAAARAAGFAPMAVAVTDAGGHVVVARREDGAGHLRLGIAEGKAWGALGLGFGTREIMESALNNRVRQPMLRVGGAFLAGSSPQSGEATGSKKP